jgi:CrcB protein
MNYIIIAIGAGIGGALRYYLSSVSYMVLPVYFPSGTLFVNFVGSIILGLMIFGLDDREIISQSVKLFIGVGFCGGLTTFSTFSLETFNLIKETEFLLATWNILLNLILTMGAIYLAYIITR